MIYHVELHEIPGQPLCENNHDIFTHELHNMLILHLWKLDHHCYGYMINHIFYSEKENKLKWFV